MLLRLRWDTTGEDAVNGKSGAGNSGYVPGDEVRCQSCTCAIRLTSETDWLGDLIWRHVITGDVRCHYKATPPAPRPTLVTTAPLSEPLP